MLLLLSIVAALLDSSAPPPDSEPVPVQIGAPAPPVVVEKLLQAPAGAATDWDSLRGNVVVLEFWTTWCAPCVAAIGHLNKLAVEFKDRPVRFIAVTDENEAKILPFLKRKEMRAWIGLDTDRSAFDAFGVRGIPCTLIIDAQGRVAAKTYPLQLTAEVLHNVLAGKPAALPVDDPDGDTVPSDADKPADFLIRIARTSERVGRTGAGLGQLDMQGVTLRHAIGQLWEMPEYRIRMDAALVDLLLNLSARMPRQRHNQLWPMLRSALETTFDFQTRRAAEEMNCLVLRVATGKPPQLTPSAMEEGGGHSTSGGGGSLGATNIKLERFANLLGARFEQPVIDETGLGGRYDFSLRWDDSKADGMLAAVREQIGLELVPVKRSMEVLIVEPVPGAAAQTVQK